MGAYLGLGAYWKLYTTDHSRGQGFNCKLYLDSATCKLLSKTVLDSGLQAVDSGFQLPDSRFPILRILDFLSVQLGLPENNSRQVPVMT